MIKLNVGHEGGGYGRIVTRSKAIALNLLIKRIKIGLNLQYRISIILMDVDDIVQVARGSGSAGKSPFIQSIAVCAGSGSSVFKELKENVDVLLTGELSHHEVLAAVEKGTHVILCGHTNTERGFLKVLKSDLQGDLDKTVGSEMLEVCISTKDHDPIEIQ